jgi:two-component system response regulator HupR/HoxA
VLVVDDEPLNRDLLRRVLAPDYDIDEAGDVEEAVSILESRQTGFHAVLCDQLMPGRWGTELAREVRARWPGTVFMLITGYDDDERVLEAQKAGVVQFVIPKPWTARGLKDLVRAALAGEPPPAIE